MSLNKYIMTYANLALSLIVVISIIVAIHYFELSGIVREIIMEIEINGILPEILYKIRNIITYDNITTIYASATLGETVTYINISGLLVNLYSAISILSLIWGNYFIDYFKLEKFPKLSRFLKLRKQMASLSISIHLLISITTSLIVIYVNIDYLNLP